MKNLSKRQSKILGLIASSVRMITHIRESFWDCSAPLDLKYFFPTEWDGGVCGVDHFIATANLPAINWSTGRTFENTFNIFDWMDYFAGESGCNYAKKITLQTIDVLCSDVESYLAAIDATFGTSYRLSECENLNINKKRTKR